MILKKNTLKNGSNLHYNQSLYAKIAHFQKNCCKMIFFTRS